MSNSKTKWGDLKQKSFQIRDLKYNLYIYIEKNLVKDFY